MNLLFPRVYPIADTSISTLPLAEQVRHLIAGGASFIQLRNKTSSAREFYHRAKEALDLADRSGVRVIINDRVDIAKVLGAAGVHLGQSDLSPVHARALLGEKAIIGYSTHTIEQAAEAVRLPIDYLAFGPIFPTSTKTNPDPVVGLSLLNEIKSLAGDLPLIAIGGINESNLQSVLAAGADSAAVISALAANDGSTSGKMQNLLALAESKNTNSV